MIIKKSGGKIFGATMTSDEIKAMNMEIQRQLAEYNKKNAEEIDAAVLLVLRKEFDFGEIRLRRFHDNFVNEMQALEARYELNDLPWLCTKLLKNDGIDLKKWREQK